MTVVEGLVLVAIGLATGLTSGVFGVGGGLVMVPALALLLGYGQHLAEGTSLLVIIPTAAVGAFTHRGSGFVRVPEAIALGAGGVVGALAGSAGALALESETLRFAFVGFLAITGVRMLLPRHRDEAR